ncbi:protein tyrosine phosphatase [Jeotgalibacillus sp. S-D1]|uniref:protein-tyrosine phosphatase family protein n=1 Tax=Jeotgalibacillus sp. S-D1 TaxID=2552189 RepID=UPI00105A7DC2|nr:dual specificity protein phosphatase family protein [Jeotgalibacillus sp. S-D1]TDL33049.1 protein tyrosine phosphatase [Jeotgalibacillus sp. S-D1]
MSNNYQSLIDHRIWIGGAADVEAVNTKETIDVVYDLRSENKEHHPAPNRIHLPIVDDESHQDESVKQAIKTVKNAVDEGKKVYFHCSGGKNRTGTLATALLLEYEKASSIEEAEKLAKSIRPEIAPKSEMMDVLKRLYPTKA